MEATQAQRAEFGCEKLLQKLILGDTDLHNSHKKHGVASTHTNPVVFVNFCSGPRHDGQVASDAADVCCCGKLWLCLGVRCISGSTRKGLTRGRNPRRGGRVHC